MYSDILFEKNEKKLYGVLVNLKNSKQLKYFFHYDYLKKRSKRCVIFYRYNQFKILLRPLIRYKYRIYSINVLNSKNHLIEKIGVYNPHIIFEKNKQYKFKGKFISIDPNATIAWLEKYALVGVLPQMILEFCGLLKRDKDTMRLQRWYVYLKKLYNF